MFFVIFALRLISLYIVESNIVVEARLQVTSESIIVEQRLPSTYWRKLSHGYHLESVAAVCTCLCSQEKVYFSSCFSKLKYVTCYASLRMLNLESFFSDIVCYQPGFPHPGDLIPPGPREKAYDFAIQLWQKCYPKHVKTIYLRLWKKGCFLLKSSWLRLK